MCEAVWCTREPGSVVAIVLIGCGGPTTGGANPQGTGGEGTGGVPPMPARHIEFVCGYPRPPAECGADGSCPAGKKCFQLTKEIGICDDPAPSDSTECTPLDKLDTPPFESRSTDECGCAGLTCASGSRCRWIEATCSCPSSGHNQCVDTPCESPADCTGDDVCTPPSFILPGRTGRCLAAPCHSDMDCIDGAAHGVCALTLRAPLQAGTVSIEKIACSF